MVYKEALGSRPATIWLKYLWQAIETFRILWRERAEVAFAMTPPVFAGLSLFLYSLVKPIKYVVDVHTAALMMPRWRRFQWLQLFVCKRAATTLVTNDHLASIIGGGGGHTTIVRDVPVVYPVSDAYARLPRIAVAVVCSFNYDEPIREMLEAAKKLPEVDFYFTGDNSRLPDAMVRHASANVRFTGFLSSSDYGSLLSHAGMVMSLTTRDHTMLRGAYEAVYMGTPVVVSNWPLLHAAFDSGAVHVESTSESISNGIREILAQPDRFRAEAHALRERKMLQWSGAKASILARLT